MKYIKSVSLVMGRQKVLKKAYGTVTIYQLERGYFMGTFYDFYFRENVISSYLFILVQQPFSFLQNIVFINKSHTKLKANKNQICTHCPKRTHCPKKTTLADLLLRINRNRALHI